MNDHILTVVNILVHYLSHFLISQLPLYQQQIVQCLSKPKNKRPNEDNQIISSFLQAHPFNSKHQFQEESMMQISKNAQLEIYPKNSIIYQQNDISQKFYIILKGQIGIYFPKNVKQRYEDYRQNNQDDIQKYTVSDYLNQLNKISTKDKDDWFGEIGLSNNGIMHQIAIAESDAQIMIIEKSCYQKYIQEKQNNLLKKKLKIFQNSIFADCSFSQQRIMYYMSKKISFNLKQIILSENEEIENIYIIKKGEFSIYKYIYDEDSMAEQNNNPRNQSTYSQYNVRQQRKESNKYSKNTKNFSLFQELIDNLLNLIQSIFTRNIFFYSYSIKKLKVIQRNEVIGDHDAILKRPSGYSCVCEGLQGGEALVIPVFIMHYIIEQDEYFKSILNERLQQKIIDFNDRVLKISSQMKKFGDFFFFKARKPEENTQKKLNSVFEINKKTKKINVSENYKSQDQGEMKEIQSITDYLQEEIQKDRQDFNDFSYFPINQSIHQKANIQKTITISSNDFKKDILNQNNQHKQKQQTLKNQESFSQRSSFSNITVSNDQNLSFSRITQQQINNNNKTKLKSQKSLQENSLFSKYLESDYLSIPKKNFSSQRDISEFNNEENNKNISLEDDIDSSMTLQLSSCQKDEMLSNSFDEQQQQQNQDNKKMFRKSKSRKTIIINDNDLIEEENHQTSQSSDDSIVSNISITQNQFKKNNYNLDTIELDNDNKQDIILQKQDLIDKLKRGCNRKQNKSHTQEPQSNKSKSFLSQTQISLNGKITDKLLQRAVEETQNLKNEILKEKDFVQVQDLQSINKNELKSLQEIRNLQQKMNQKQDATKYDELLKTSQMRVLDINIKLNEQKNKAQLEEERQRKEKEQNSMNEQQKEEIIRKYISKIGLVSPSNSIQLSKKSLNSPANSIENLQLSGTMSTGRNIPKNLQLQQLQKKSPFNDSLYNLRPPLSCNDIKNNDFERINSQRLSQVNFSTQVSSNNFDTNLISNQQLDADSKVSQVNVGIESNYNENEEINSHTKRGSFINYNQFAYSTPQNNKSNQLRKFVQQSQLSDQLNIGLKQNQKSVTPQGRIEQSLNFSYNEILNTPYTQTNQQIQGKKQKIHFKSSVDEYIEVKANALSNNFDKKRIKIKDLPILESYANQLQINLKRLFYSKLKEHQYNETQFENVQNRVADQILDQNIKQFIQNNKDILPERQDLNYLYNWRKQSQKKSMTEKYQENFSQSQLQSKTQIQQDYLKDNIPPTGFISKKTKLPNIQKQKYSSTELSIILANSTQNINSSNTLEKQIQTSPKHELFNNRSQVVRREQQSNVFQKLGRQKFISERELQFTQNFKNLNKQYHKEQRNLKTLNSIEIQQSTQKAHGSEKKQSLINIDAIKKLSYKEFQDIYENEQQKIEDLKDKARYELTNLDKFYHTNQKADDAMKNDQELSKRLSTLDTIASSNCQSSRQLQMNKLKKQSTLDNFSLEEEQMKTQQKKLSEEELDDDQENKKPLNNLKNEYYQNNNMSSQLKQLKKYLQVSSSCSNILPNQKNSQKKRVSMKSVEEEMKELTHSIIQKYGLHQKYKSKHFR